jgi:hypothetical protein
VNYATNFFVKNAKIILKIAIYVIAIFVKIVALNVYVVIFIVTLVLYNVKNAEEEFVIYARLNAIVILLFFVINA